MSLFLGPIHQWLYDKIIFQEDLTDALIDAGKAEGWSELTEELANECHSYDRRPLEEAVDPDNIHGSLQARIADAECRYAKLVQTIAAANPARVEDLKQAARRFGKLNAVPAGTKPDVAFGYLNNTLLDGMPCDNVNEMIGQTDDSITWRRNMDIHAQHWANEEDELYYVLRAEIVKGMFEPAGLTYEEPQEGTYEIRA